MRLIDLVYLNSPGGLNLAKYLINYLLKNENSNQFLLLIDIRNSIHFNKYEIKKVTVSKNELSRFLFYKKNATSLKSILCFSNVPPPLKIKSKTFIYFHNEILLDSKNLGFSKIKQLIFKLKWEYIKSRNSNYTWLVQTIHIQRKLSNALGVSKKKVIIAPIFNDVEQKNELVIEDSFIYPTSNKEHKNNTRLIEGFIMVAKEVSIPIYFEITLTKIELEKISKTIIPSNLKIISLGMLPHDELISRISRSKFLVFPSLIESFGLPLIEAIQNGCKVLASDLEYVNEIIEPSLVFDPYSVKSISEVIKKALLGNSLKKSKLIVSNKLEMIINQLIQEK